MADFKKSEEREENVEPVEAYVYILELKDPESQISFEPPILIYLYPPESEIYQNAMNKLTNQEGIVKKLCLNSDNMAVKLWEILGDFLAECTYDWENIEWESETLFCNYDNAKMVFMKIPWVRDQVTNYYGSSSKRNINIILNRDQVVSDYKFIYEQCADAQTHISMKIEGDYGARPHQLVDPSEGYFQDALSALVKLGFHKKLAEKALDAVRGKGAKNLEDLVRQSLQWLSPK